MWHVWRKFARSVGVDMVVDGLLHYVYAFFAQYSCDLCR